MPGTRADPSSNIVSMPGVETPSTVTDGADSVVVDVTSGPLAGPVLTRVVAAMAARSGLTLDRVNDARLAIEALAAHSAPHLADGHLHVRVTSLPGSLTMRLGPLRNGGAEAVVSETTLPALGPVLHRLADEVRPEGDHLVIVIGPPA